MKLTSRAIGDVLLLAVGLAAIFVLPRTAGMFMLIDGTIYAALSVLALSLGLVWGFGGILSFGQAAFFGLGGYTYAVVAINTNDTTLAAAIAMLVPMLAAALVGYFIFWGRISDVYLGVITLTLSLILYHFFNQTAGDVWKIGTAPLGGFNGIPNTPALTMPGDPDNPLDPDVLYQVAVAALALTYAICRLVLATRFGRVVVAVRENETRAELLGYDVRYYKLGIFMLGSLMAGMAGVLFSNAVFVSPNMFSLQTSGQIIIWVIVGGRGTLLGPIIGCVLIELLSTTLGAYSQSSGTDWLDPNLVLGVLLMVFVLLVPRGLVPLVRDAFVWLWRRIAPARVEPGVTVGTIGTAER
jgi:branched-chain amino acid transport system permease protein